MTRFHDPDSYERYQESFSFRMSAAARAFIVSIARERNCGLGEAARIVIDDAMARWGKK